MGLHTHFNYVRSAGQTEIDSEEIQDKRYISKKQILHFII